MDLLLLDGDTRRADVVIEGWDSLIWTERYNDIGEFELKSSAIQTHRGELQLGEYVGIRGSKQPMRIETHSIEVDDDGKEILTVNGRAMESLTEDRTNLASLSATSGTGVVPLDIPNMVVALSGLLSYQINDPDFMFPVEADRIPEVSFQQEFTETSTPNYSFPDADGELAEQVYKILKQCNYGLRGIRPDNTHSGFILSLYKGSDKSATVIFRASQGHIKPTSYLWSIKGSKNVGYIRTPHGGGQFNYPGLVTTPTGLARRDLYVDGSDIQQTAGSQLNSMMKIRVQTELQKNKTTEAFDFQMLPISPYKFGVDYYLGDRVKVEANYGLSEIMYVSEFIRNQDEQGYREYPTLAEYVPAEYV